MIAEQKIEIHVRRNLLGSLREMYRLAALREAMTFQAFIGQLVETSIADFRASEAGRRTLGISPSRTDGKYLHRRKYPK
jgi:hypothetical protein